METTKYLVATAILLMGAMTIHCAHGSQVLWQANFENEKFNTLSYLLNPQGISIEKGKTRCGAVSAKLVVKGDPSYLWNDNPDLNRVEMQYQPQTVKPGGRTFISWYLMFPEQLVGKHEFAYWESNRTYQQIMRFEVSQGQISFRDSKSGNAFWKTKELETNKWYKVAMQIDWSAKQVGKVSVWWQDTLVVDAQSMQTLVSENEASFLQLGLLRKQAKASSTILIDHISEVKNRASLLANCI